MYSIPSIHGYKTHGNGSFAKRVLQEAEKEKEEEKKVNKNAIHATGNTVAGIFVLFLFMVPIIVMINYMDSIFVNTKVVRRSLLVGKIDS